MQTSVPDLVDLHDETQSTLDMYGADTKPRNVREELSDGSSHGSGVPVFIQLYHRGWDQHYNLPSDLRLQCRDIDQPVAALIRDLKQRGLLMKRLLSGAANLVAQLTVRASWS